MKQNRYIRFLTLLILVAMTISPAFLLGDMAKNLFLIGVMALSPLVILRYLEFDKRGLLLIAFMGVMIFATQMNHPETMRWSTVLYTCMFCTTFIAYSSLLRHSCLSVETYEKLIKYILYAYCIVLIIQQFCVLTGLPIFNLSNYDIKTPWKLNSLTSEPSHSVRYVALLMYCFITMRETTLGRSYLLKTDLSKDKWVWVSFLWVMIMSISATAFLFLAIIFTKFVKLKNLISIGVIIILTVIMVKVSGITVFDRTYKTAVATLTLDEKAIVQADHSGSARIVPLIICAKRIDISTIDGWFGHGVDYVSTIMYQLFPGVPKGYTGGGIFLVGVEYGAIALALFVLFSFNTVVQRNDIISLLFWVFMCLNEGVNLQITWAAIIFMYTNRFLVDRYNVNLNK